MSELQVTPAGQWRRTELVELPSGKVAELQRVNILTMLQQGKDDAPNFLKSQVAASLVQNGAKKTAQNPQFELKDPDEAVDMIHFFAKKAFVNPVLVDGQPQAENEVYVGHISEEDLVVAMSYALGDSATITALKEFREQAKADVERLPAGADMEPVSEQYRRGES